MNFSNDNFFLDVKEQPFDFVNQQASQPVYSPSIGGGAEQVFQLGTGEQSINMDFSGLWIGASRFLNAPFRVAINGDTQVRARTTDGVLIMDEMGIESTHNFPNVDSNKTDDQVVTGTTWVDVLGLTHEIKDIVRPVYCLAMADVSGFHDDVGGRLEFRFLINNVQTGSIFCLNRVAAAGAIQTKTGLELALLKTGTNQIIVQARSSNANSGTISGATIPCFLHHLLLGR